MASSLLDRALGFYESVADLAAAWGKDMFPQHRKAIEDFQRLLAAHGPGVRWLIVGAVGVMEYLTPEHQRMTGDIDAVVEIDDLKAFFQNVPLEEFNFRPGRKFLAVYVELLHQPEGTPLQLMHPRLADVPHLFEAGHTVPILGGSAPVAAAEHLLIMKTRSLGSVTRSPRKRATDRADLISLLVDRPEVRSAAELFADTRERKAIAEIARDAELERDAEEFPQEGTPGT